MALKKAFIPKFLQRRTFDIMMFGFVDAIHMEFPSIAVKSAIAMFADRYNLSPEDFDGESAFTTYYRMKAELKDFDIDRAKV